MNQKFIDILDASRHKHKFPPRDKARAIKLSFNAKGVLQSSMAAIAITNAYIDSASAVLEDFTEIVLKNRATVGLTSEKEISDVFFEAFQNVTNEARGCALSELDGFQRWILQVCNERLPPLLDHLNRKVRLKDLDLGGTMSLVHITGSQIGNLVLGSVNQSELTATVTDMVKHGGAEAELGKALQSMIGVVGKMDSSLKAEQAQLFDLLKGLLQQINLPKQERSRSAIKAIWDRVVEVSQVSNEVTQIAQTVLPMIPALLNR